MLRATVITLVVTFIVLFFIAILAALLGYGGVAGATFGITQIVLYVLLTVGVAATAFVVIRRAIRN